MALLPQSQRDQYRLLGIIVVLAIGAMYFLYMYKPKQQQLAEMEDRVAMLQKQNEVAQKAVGNLDQLKAQLQGAQDEYAALQKLVPSRAEVPQIYAAIASQSQTLGLDLVNVAPSAPVSDSSSYFMHQNWDMRVEGEYHNVGEFLTRVASFDRIVKPDIQEIRPTEETQSGRQKVEAAFSLETFVLPPSSDSTGSAAGAKAKKGDSDAG